MFLHEDSLATQMLLDPNKSENNIAYHVYKNGAKKDSVNKGINQSVINGGYQPDLLSLDAAFLIQNIDATFKVRESPFCKNLSFKDFCEYVLPYRINTEPVYPVRKKLQHHFRESRLLDSVEYSLQKTISTLNDYTYKFCWEWSDPKSDPYLGFYSIFYWNHINCVKAVATYGNLMRSAGLPVNESFTPKWRSYPDGHSWCTLLNSDGSLDLLTAVYTEPGSLSNPWNPLRATKIYQKPFSPQMESPYFLKAPEEQIPPLYASPCIRDITSQFLASQNIKLKLDIRQKGKNLCWFSMFRTGQWMPVGWGTLNWFKTKATFKNISEGLTGIACSFDGREVVPCSKLVTVTSNGLEYIAPGEKKMHLVLRRKFPVSERLKGMREKMVGTRILGANRPDFSDTVMVHVIKDTLQPWFQDMVFDHPGTFRYYRMEAPTWHLNIAELEFLTEENTCETSAATPLPVFQNHVAPQKQFYKINYLVIPNSSDSVMFNGDLLSFYANKRIALDLGKPRKINRVRIAPRNALNGIVTGDNYQLFYWDDEWISAGVQQAESNYLEYEDVPANTLYWLRNLDHGKEEQPFFYKDGKQTFSNQPQTPK